MIKLDLGAEPVELTAERVVRLPKAIAAFNTHGHGSKELNAILDKGYQVAREFLMQRQYDKCAFCENLEDSESRPVEHFRPKKEAHDDTLKASPVVDTSHYWWLTWSWSNLYFSCIKCNKKGNKGSLFPIAAGTRRAEAPRSPITDPIPSSFYDLSAECALLVDPRVDEPLDHLQWIPVNATSLRSRWRWTISGASDRGTETIRIFGLKDRIDRVNGHLEGIKLVAIEIDKHIANKRFADAREAFSGLVEQFVENPRRPFRNAAYWALDALFPEATRTAVGLGNLPKPYVAASTSPSPNSPPAKAKRMAKASKSATAPISVHVKSSP